MDSAYEFEEEVDYTYYPNPTSDYVIFRFERYSNVKFPLNLYLYTLDGRLANQMEISDQQQFNIPVRKETNAYLFSIIDANKKIICNNRILFIK
jgi:hypothetical protein